ncbi:MAG: SRPBCC family protein, partial [Variibacter sp.]|nr:SRPBCC family protein [Variibacter sp.]
MQFENTFTIAVGPEEAWPLLLDVPAIAPCLPGAEITEALGERKFRGRATVKVGPVQLAFAGEAEIVDVDEAARSARVVARGADQKGRGNASAAVTFSLLPDAAGSRVNVVTDLTLVGAVAQYGRGAGLLKLVA